MNRVCMHMPSAGGGHPLYVQEMMVALTRRGSGACAVELVTSVDLEERFLSSEYPVHRVLPRLVHKKEFRNRLSWAANRAVHYPVRERRFLAWLKSRPDIAGVHFQEFNFWMPTVVRAVHRMGKKAFFTVHYVHPHAYPPLLPRAAWDARHRLACRLCDRLFVLSGQVREELSAFLGHPHPPIEIAPHGVWTVQNPSQLPSLDQRLRHKRLLFFGTMRRNKGLDLVLDAMPQLPEFQLTIAGAPREAGYFYNEVMPTVRRLVAGGARIDVIDRFVTDEETASLFASHSAILLPYTREFTAQSGVIFLALSHEIPVVCSRVGGLSDVVDEFHIGSVFRQPTAPALVAAVRTLFSAEQSSVLAGHIRRAREHFSWDESARATLRGYALTFQEQSSTDDCRVVTVS
jgi:glycosyltransferase involved in cell wall biosynthesis